MRAPEFWTRDGWAARALGPLGAVIDAVGRRRRAAVPPVRADLPVLCVGNATVGGAGKTPTALALAERLATRGRRPVFLTRGHGGSRAGPHPVDPAADDAQAVGDEALLLAARHPTVVARDRVAGASLCLRLGGDVIVMDDGFQNPGLRKDVALLVVDGPAGIGNARLFPAGPMRERWPDALARANAVVMVGEDVHGLVRDLPAGVAVLRASLAPNLDDLAALDGGPVVAFAGIGRPAKFFGSLLAAGIAIAERVAFADHHRFTDADLDRLERLAANRGARLVTTAKDAIRLAPDRRAGIAVLRVALRFEAPEQVDRLLDGIAP
jgi:tetraacyldisaccharide 4'-kinase